MRVEVQVRSHDFPPSIWMSRKKPCRTKSFIGVSEVAGERQTVSCSEPRDHSFSPFSRGAYRSWPITVEAAYDMETTTSIKGTITVGFDWTNPHSIISVDVKSEQGGVEKWLVETEPPTTLDRCGWSSNGQKSGFICEVRRRRNASWKPREERPDDHGSLKNCPRQWQRVERIWVPKVERRRVAMEG